MTSAPRIGCAILAAETSGGIDRDRQLLSVNGQSLAERVTLAACRSRVTRTAVIVRSRADEVAAAVSNLPVDIISSLVWPPGLAAAVRSAVGWARGRHYDGLLLVRIDEPSLSTSLLDALLVASQGGQQLVGADYDGVVGFPALFPRESYPRLEALTGDSDTRAIVEGADPEFPFLTVNVPRRVARAMAPATRELTGEPRIAVEAALKDDRPRPRTRRGSRPVPT
ncbi:MAG: xdh [Myxococcales bacterium]|nr:xdh [Myxococcales bacterium]